MVTLGSGCPHPPLGDSVTPLTLLFRVILLRILGFVVGDTPNDGGFGGRPAPQVDLPVQRAQRFQHGGGRQGPNGADVLGLGLLL